MSMRERFEGVEGRKRLISALQEQHVVEHQVNIAERLVDQGEVVEFKQDDSVIEQGGSDTDAFFILSGQAKVFVNHREVETRGARELIGEFVAVDPSAPRSATVKAHGGPLVTFKVPGDVLLDVANAYPSIWRVIARAAHDSIRNRERFHRPKNDQPILFIGCSTEGLEIASAIQEEFKHDEITVERWTDGVFGPGGVPIDNLIAEVDKADFALFVFTPDDKVLSRKDEHEAPRDNVVFELGLFMARLGRTRTFLLREHKSDLKIPSDLLGITPVTYVYKASESLKTQLAPPCNELRRLFKGLGAF